MINTCFFNGLALKYSLLPQRYSITDFKRRRIKALFSMRPGGFYTQAPFFFVLYAVLWRRRRQQQQKPAEAGPRKVETLLNFLHRRLEAAPSGRREAAAAAAAAEAWTRGRTHGPRRLSPPHRRATKAAKTWERKVD